MMVRILFYVLLFANIFIFVDSIVRDETFNMVTSMLAVASMCKTLWKTKGVF